MKKTLLLAFILTALTTGPLLGQPAPPQPDFQDRVRQIIDRANPAAPASALTKFDLNFPGGTANQLADAIEKATGKPLNVIVPDEFARTKLPPIKVTAVTVPQLFDTLQTGSRRYFNSEVQSSYGFTSNDNSKNDSTIWTFSVYTNQAASGQLTKFSIDFPGGTPKQLVTAIQKSTGRPLNAIIPDDSADIKLPPLKMNDVNVSELFHALELASYKSETYRTSPGPSYQQRSTSYGFRMDGKLSDDTVWYFHADKIQPPMVSSPEKICRFYALAPFLDRGLKVDDITTAVETAWKMSGETSPPAISFHKDTKLLIAVGEPEKLQIIDSILQALKSEPPKLPAPPEKKSSDAKLPE